MNINNLIKSVNIDKAMEGVEYGTGTFGNILYNVSKDIIYPLVNNVGDVIGIGYESGCNGAEDSIAKMKFERAYCGKPVQDWVNKALQIKYSGKAWDEVKEDDCNIKVVFSDGSEEIISGYVEAYCHEDDDLLPDEVEIDIEDECFEQEPGEDHQTRRAIKRYLKDTYGYYLSGNCENQFDYEVGDDRVYVSNIQWGRAV